MSSPERPPADRYHNEASVAEAMEEAERAEARAEAARARARRLSRKANAAPHDQRDIAAGLAAEGNDSATVEDSAGQAEPSSASPDRLARRWLPRPGRKALTVGAAAVFVCTSLGVSGYVAQYHRNATAQQQRAAEFAAAARKGVVALMSIDSSKAREDLQHIIDDATGQLKGGFLIAADELVKAVEQSKISTKVDVKAVAVESMTKDSAVVLVAATAQTVNPDKSKPPPRSWRVIITVQRDAGQLKVSRADLLP